MFEDLGVILEEEVTSELIAARESRAASKSIAEGLSVGAQKKRPTMKFDFSSIQPKKIFITEPIRFKTNIDYVYRWDRRTPKQVLKEGFLGSNNEWFNKIFGNKTVFAARDLEGSDYYFSELESACALTGECPVYYRYKINAGGIPAVDISENRDAGFIKSFATRLPEVDLHFYDNQTGSLSHTIFSRFNRYVNELATLNHEVQLCGGINPDRIVWMDSRKVGSHFPDIADLRSF